VKDGVMLEAESRDATLRHVRNLWGYDVSLAAIDGGTGAMLSERWTKEL
jgi:stage V sporulation protein R